MCRQNYNHVMSVEYKCKSHNSVAHFYPYYLIIQKKIIPLQNNSKIFSYLI